MKVLVLGSGGREHALVEALVRGGHRVWWGPGNGAEGPWQRLALDLTQLDQVVQAARELAPDLVLVGPEDPLAAGLVDRLQAAGIASWGPTAQQARLESSKGWAKAFMRRWNLPTAEFWLASGAEQARQLLPQALGPQGLVIKADGLAGGKGVAVVDDLAQAQAALEELPAGPLVLERRLSGPEASLILLTRPDGYQALPLARDHKRLLEGDLGPNTGGMGCLAPLELGPDLPELQPLCQRLWQGLVAEGLNYFGALFLGLMLTSEGPQILEFNCRLGDPETEALMALLDNDLLEVLQGQPARLKPGVAVDLVLASAGYPASSSKGLLIEGLPTQGVQVLQAATRRSPQGQLLTDGGRVLHLVAQAPSLPEALTQVYQAAESVRFGGQPPVFRRDIGASSLAAQS